MAAKYDHKGTAIKGTSSVLKDGCAGKKSDLYFNKDSGHVYKASKTGKKSDKIWKYTRTDIAKKPSTAVSSLAAPARQSGNRVMKSTWTVPKKLTEKDNGARAQEMNVTWKVGNLSDLNVSYGKETQAESQINLDNFKIGKTTYNRSSFYPNSSRKLSAVSVTVNPHNSKGNGTKPVTATRNFTAPRIPTFAGWTFDSENGTIANTIDTNAGADYQERYDTRYTMEIDNSRTGEKWNHLDTSSASTSIPVSYDALDYQQLTYDEYIKVTLTAYARGYAGDSAKQTDTFYISYPKRTTIIDVDVDDKSFAGKCTVFVDTNQTTEHPVDRVVLEYLANCDYKTANAIPGEAAWSNTDIKDNGDCTALAMPVANLIPEPGKYTWIRVKSYHADETVLHRYSQPWRVTDLETPAPTAADDYITILNTEPGANGESAVVTLGWNQDGEDDSTGTELTWSSEEDTWKSTEEPETYEFTWSDGELEWEGITYHDSAEIVIKGLDEGTTYFVRARRYLEGETVSYSPYSNPATVMTSETPDAVVATASRYTPIGGSLPVYWTFTGSGLQTSWQIVDSEGTVIADGEGSIGSTQISADRIEEFAIDGSLTFTVQVSTGSGYVVSEEHTVTIINPPELEITAITPMIVQPFSFIATSDRLCNLTVIVSSQGAAGQKPYGIARQTAGDTIYSAVITPEWTAGQDGNTATITLPPGLDFWDNGLYTLTVGATDLETGLTSETQTFNFSVDWSHKAPSPASITTYESTIDTVVDEDKTYYEYNGETEEYDPVDDDGSEDPSAEHWYERVVTDYVTLTPIDETDDNGWHHQAVQIDLTPTPDCAESDLYDIYRITGDGARLIGEGFPLTYTAVDEYAPFGDDMTLHYRIAVRTVDGDAEFSDIEYAAPGSTMRFDWADGSLELPYNISISDKYAKDVEIRNHMGGDTDAYWNENITRTGSLNSDLIRLEQQDEINMARQLARYAGAVFVRTPDGSAYEADVQVSDLSTDGTMSSIAVDATEIGLTTEFILPTPYNLEEEEE